MTQSKGLLTTKLILKSAIFIAFLSGQACRQDPINLRSDQRADLSRSDHTNQDSSDQRLAKIPEIQRLYDSMTELDSSVNKSEFELVNEVRYSIKKRNDPLPDLDLIHAFFADEQHQYSRDISKITNLSLVFQCTSETTTNTCQDSEDSKGCLCQKYALEDFQVNVSGYKNILGSKDPLSTQTLINLLGTERSIIKIGLVPAFDNGLESLKLVASAEKKTEGLIVTTPLDLVFSWYKAEGMSLAEVALPDLANFGILTTLTGKRSYKAYSAGVYPWKRATEQYEQQKAQDLGDKSLEDMQIYTCQTEDACPGLFKKIQSAPDTPRSTTVVPNNSFLFKPTSPEDSFQFTSRYTPAPPHPKARDFCEKCSVGNSDHHSGGVDYCLEKFDCQDFTSSAYTCAKEVGFGDSVRMAGYWCRSARPPHENFGHAIMVVRHKYTINPTNYYFCAIEPQAMNGQCSTRRGKKDWPPLFLPKEKVYGCWISPNSNAWSLSNIDDISQLGCASNTGFNKSPIVLNPETPHFSCGDPDRPPWWTNGRMRWFVETQKGQNSYWCQPENSENIANCPCADPEPFQYTHIFGKNYENEGLVESLLPPWRAACGDGCTTRTISEPPQRLCDQHVTAEATPDQFLGWSTCQDKEEGTTCHALYSFQDDTKKAIARYKEPPSRCGDGNRDSPLEECDGVRFCTNECQCEEGFKPAVDETENACYEIIGCGDGRVQSDFMEECDGGIHCTSQCKCESGFIPDPNSNGCKTPPTTAKCTISLGCSADSNMWERNAYGPCPPGLACPKTGCEEGNHFGRCNASLPDTCWEDGQYRLCEVECMPGPSPIASGFENCAPPPSSTSLNVFLWGLSGDNDEGRVIGPGINCKNDCTETYDSSGKTTFKANVPDGYRFDRWRGCSQVSNQECSIDIPDSGTNAYSITAVFEKLPSCPRTNDGQHLTKMCTGPNNFTCCEESDSCNGSVCVSPVQYNLTVSKNGSGTVQGGGIDCGSTCSKSFISGTEVELNATGVQGEWEFNEWAPCGDTNNHGDSVCRITMDKDQVATAVFEQPEVQPNTCPTPDSPTKTKVCGPTCCDPSERCLTRDNEFYCKAKPSDPCKRIGGTCSLNSECCSQNCTAGFCREQGDVCGQSGALCRSSGECCGDLSCTTNNSGLKTCGGSSCRSQGTQCSASSQCCNNLSCAPGNSGLKVCGGASCRSFGLSCERTTDCCEGRICDGPTGQKTCGGSPASCKSLNTACSADSQCCSDRCASGRCREAYCEMDTYPCSNDWDCCSDKCSNFGTRAAPYWLCGTVDEEQMPIE